MGCGIPNISDGSKNTNRQMLFVAAVLLVCAVVFATHWPALSAKAIFADDDQYILDNPLVKNPSWSSAGRFLTEVFRPSTVRGYYQPLSMISLMLDYAAAGGPDNLWPFHLTSLMLHVLNTALVVVLLYMLLGNFPAAAAAGLLFGVHPMTVEPLPWLSERKTLLAAFFSLLSLVFYVLYAKKTAFSGQSSADRVLKSKDHLTNHHSPITMYTACLAAYTLALMSKPTATPLPAVMLMMDFWPLNRLSWKRVWEKLPLFIVGGVSAVITYISQRNTCFTVVPGEYDIRYLPLMLCHNIVFYPYKMIWPVNLSSFYTFPVTYWLSDPMMIAGIIGTGILIPVLLISLRWTRAVLTGWLIFFTAIFPTMGVIGFTTVIASDKFAYLPSIGLLMIITVFLKKVTAGKKSVAVITAAIVSVLLIAEITGSRRYMAFWQNTEKLYGRLFLLTPQCEGKSVLYNNFGFWCQGQGNIDRAEGMYREAVAVNQSNYKAHGNLGKILQSKDRMQEALTHYVAALQANPDDPQTNYQLGLIYQFQEKFDQALSCYRKAIAVNQHYAEANNSLGYILKSAGRLDEAADCFLRAVADKPDYAEAYSNLIITLLRQKKFEEAIDYCRRVLLIKPDYAEVHNNMGMAFVSLGRIDDGISCFRKVLQYDADHVQAHNNLGYALKLQSRFDEAMEHYSRALQIKPDYAAALNGLAEILSLHPDAKKRDYGRAVELAERAARLTGYKDAGVLETLANSYKAAGQLDKAEGIRKKLEFYKQQK